MASHGSGSSCNNNNSGSHNNNPNNIPNNSSSNNNNPNNGGRNNNNPNNIPNNDSSHNNNNNGGSSNSNSSSGSDSNSSDSSNSNNPQPPQGGASGGRRPDEPPNDPREFASFFQGRRQELGFTPTTVARSMEINFGQGHAERTVSRNTVRDFESGQMPRTRFATWRPIFQSWLNLAPVLKRRKAPGSPMLKKKMKKVKFTPYQDRVLQSTYRRNKLPTKSEMRMLAKKLELTFAQVKNWFIHRRRKDRKAAAATQSATSGASPSSSSPAAAATP